MTNLKYDPPLSSDMACTGFPNGLGSMNWLHCCIEHDLGGSDGRLLDCVVAEVPAWGAGIVVLCVLVMVILRPVYNLLQRWGWVK